jgi:hypothetical protein
VAFDEDMVYLRYDFNFNVDSEIQSFGIWGKVTKEGVGTTPGWQDMVDAIALKGVTTWSDEWGGGGFSPSLVAVRCVAYHYDQPLKNVLDRGEAAFDGDNAWSGSASASLPAENSVVASLYGYDPSGFVPQRGRKRGRIYLPTPGASAVDGTGRLTTANQGTYRDHMVAWFNALTGVLDLDQSPDNIMHWRPQVVSRAGSMNTLVRFIRVGQVIDTQRRRRNAMAENYLTAAVNVP